MLITSSTPSLKPSRSFSHSKQNSSPQSADPIPVAHSIPYVPAFSFGDVHLLRSPHIVTIPSRTRRLLNVVDIRAAAASSSATARRLRDGRAVAHVRLTTATPGTGQSAYTPQPQDEQGPGDRADDDSGNPASGNRAGTSVRSTSHKRRIDGCL